MASIVRFGPSSNSCNSVIFLHIKVKLCMVLQGTLKPMRFENILQNYIWFSDTIFFKAIWTFTYTPSAMLCLFQLSQVTFWNTSIRHWSVQLVQEKRIFLFSPPKKSIMADLMGPWGSQMAERLGNRLGDRSVTQKVAGSIPSRTKNDVSLGKALHPTCFGGMSLYVL